MAFVRGNKLVGSLLTTPPQFAARLIGQFHHQEFRMINELIGGAPQTQPMISSLHVYGDWSGNPQSFGVGNPKHFGLAGGEETPGDMVWDEPQLENNPLGREETARALRLLKQILPAIGHCSQSL